MAISLKGANLPKNFAEVPARYPAELFRLQIEAARRYLYEGEIIDALANASISSDVVLYTSDSVITVAQIAQFMQALRELVGDEKATQFGREAFLIMSIQMPRAAPTTSPRGVMSTSDKIFLKLRDTFAVINKQCNSNFVAKWHGGAEADIFEDTAQHCYGFRSSAPACATMTGFVQEAIHTLANVNMAVVEYECMAVGALTCRWHCHLL